MREHLVGLHDFMRDALDDDSSNIAVLYYYSLTCMLRGKFSSSSESLKLLEQLYSLNYQGGKYIVMDYFKTKANNIQSLLNQVYPKKIIAFKL